MNKDTELDILNTYVEAAYSSLKHRFRYRIVESEGITELIIYGINLDMKIQLFIQNMYEILFTGDPRICHEFITLWESISPYRSIPRLNFMAYEFPGVGYMNTRGLTSLTIRRD